MIAAAIQRVLGGADLSREEIAGVIGQIMDGGATPAQIGGFLVGLRAKGETVDELVGAATAMRARAVQLECARPEQGIDTCGTGGDGAGTVNISTLAAIILAGCGAAVAKHGNRALSSRCGSADVLEALGVAADADASVVARCIAEAGIGFAFAPRFHAATRHVAGPRRELGTRTIFNLLGPLTNPAHVRHQVVGVYDARWCEPVAAALGALGVRRAAVVHGHGNLDELSVRGPTVVAIWDGERAYTRALSPADFGLDDADPAALAGGDAAFNAEVLSRVLAADLAEGRAVVAQASLMSAALGLALLADGALDLSRAHLAHQLDAAHAAIADGRAAAVLDRWRALAPYATPAAAPASPASPAAAPAPPRGPA
ncbi:MAG TPA: anthranilate phosphoribosyltransferase [Kofleriaceae bacterium]|jgi:anthranilate phosphoribosyltransferase